MANSKKLFQLVNNEMQLPLDIRFGDSDTTSDIYNYTDWDLDGNGAIRTIMNQEATTQSALKCVFTEKQDNGYGTNIYDFIGEKDVGVRRSSLFMDITMAMLTLKMLIDEEVIRQNLGPEDMIATMGKLIVTEDPDDPSTSKIKMSLITNADAEVTVGVV